LSEYGANLGATFSPAALSLLPLALMGKVRRAWPFFALAVAYWFGIFLSNGGSPRFYWVVQPLVIIGIGISAFGAHNTVGNFVKRILLGLAAAGGVCIFAGVSMFYLPDVTNLFCGRLSQDQYLQRNTPYYEVYSWCNAFLPTESRVASSIGASYYLCYPKDLFGELSAAYSKINSAVELADSLRKRGVDYLILSHSQSRVVSLAEKLVQEGLLIPVKKFEHVYAGGRIHRSTYVTVTLYKFINRRAEKSIMHGLQ